MEAITLKTLKQKHPNAYSILIDNINPDTNQYIKAEPGYIKFQQIGLALKQKANMRATQ